MRERETHVCVLHLLGSALPHNNDLKCVSESKCSPLSRTKFQQEYDIFIGCIKAAPASENTDTIAENRPWNPLTNQWGLFDMQKPDVQEFNSVLYPRN